MPAPRTFRSGTLIGAGGYACVHDAVEEPSGRLVALKKSRVSQKIQRPHLQHESRILWLLRGHPAIPTIFAYGHLPHFEYLAMELLGPSLKDCIKGPISTKTGARVVLQMLSALDHIHTHGIVHCDIKPDNILCSLTDPSKVVLIDFGISRGIAHGVPAKPDPSSAPKRLVGTPHWASVNAHRSLALGPRDDLESLAFTALFLVRGDLPWRTITGRRGHFEPEERALPRIYAAKASTSGATLGGHFPPAFGGLLDYSRSLALDDVPDYADWRAQFAALDITADPHAAAAPLDWAAVGRAVVWVLPAFDISAGEDSMARVHTLPADTCDKSKSSSYFDAYGEYEIHSARDESLTLPTAEADLADSGIPPIADVLFCYNYTSTVDV